MQGSSSYRPDIDGLRAFAVILVLLFHAFPTIAPGGFVGVDVFFVISGFLITRIIFSEISANRFSVKSFYARRARRIFPALAVCLLASAGAGLWLLLPNELRMLGEQLAASSAFAANFYFWFQSGYFAPASRTLPLLHLWSLGVEEQFYIVWPLLLLGLRRMKAALPVIVCILIASFVLNLALSGHQEANFYSPVTRAWELMLGAVLAVRARPIAKSFPDAVTLAGLVLILASCVLFSDTDSYPSWRAAVPVAGAALIIEAADNSNYVATILRAPLIVGIGRISYPLYLWHWPLLVFGAAFKGAALTLAERGLAVGIAFFLAWLTFRFVESPFRRELTVRTSVLSGSAGLVTAALAGVILMAGNGFEGRFPIEIREIARGLPYPDEWRIHRCLLGLPIETNYVEDCIEKRGRSMLVVWGDSTAAALMPGLRNLQHFENLDIAQLTASRCEPLIGFEVPGLPACRSHNEYVLDQIGRIRPQIVVLHGTGISYPESVLAWDRTIRALKELGIPRIVVLSPMPVWRRMLPAQFVTYFTRHHQMLPERSSDLVFKRWDEVDMRQRLERLGAVFISGWEALCDATGCLTKIGTGAHNLTAFDTQHLTAAGSVYLINAIRSELTGAPGDKPPLQ